MRTTLFDESGLAAIYPGAWARVQAAMQAKEPQAARPTSAAAQPPNVAVINIHGVITKSSSWMTELFGGIGLDSLQAQLYAAQADDTVRGIVLHVDSPGGGVYGVDEAAEVIASVAKRKPVYAFTDGMMASAAYWLGSAATRIVATPSAEVGSVGVYALHHDYSGALEQEGVKVTLVKAGEFKAEANPFQPLSEDDREAMQARIDAYFASFTKRVARGRGVPIDDARGARFGAGRVMGSAQAVSAGMVDEIGTFADVLRGLTREASPRAAAAADETLRYRVQAAQLAG